MTDYQTIFSQNDPLWKNILLGNSTSITLGIAGCYVCSFAMIANRYGKSINPSEMNQKLKDSGLFVQDDLISSDDDLQKIYPDITYVKTYHYENDPADLSLLQQLVSDISNSVIIEIDLGNGQVHFSPVCDCDGNRVQIVNSWDGKLEDLGTVYGDPAKKILKFVVYKGTPDPLVCDKKSIRDMLVTKATSTDTIGNYLGFTPLAISSTQFGDEVVAKIKTLEEKASSNITYTVPTTTAQDSQQASTVSTTSSVATSTVSSDSMPLQQAKQNFFQWFMNTFFTKQEVSN